MRKAPEIVFKAVDHSDAIEQTIRDRIARLEHLFPQITGCTVVVDAPHRHSYKGKLYSIKVDMTVPGRELVVSRDRQRNHAHEDVYVAIRDAFVAAEAQLRTFAAKRRPADTKRHDTQPYGIISEVAWGEGWGRIDPGDGHSVYFHRNAVVNAAFEDLEVGKPVFFVETDGDEGPQASTVRLISAPR